MEDLPEKVTIANEVYWLNISKEKGKWFIAYHIVRVSEETIWLDNPPHFSAEGELNQCIAEIKRQISNANSQPKATK